MIKTLLRIGLALAFALTGVALVATGASSDVNEDKNHVEYWEALGYGECTKVENPGGTSVTLPAAPEGFFYTILVVKAGSEQSTDNPNLEYLNPVAGTVYASPGGKTVSHYIYCVKPTPPPTTPPVTTTTPPPVTTTPPPVTTTAPPTTATVTPPPETTTAPPETETETAPPPTVPDRDTLAHTGGTNTLALGAGLVLLLLGALLMFAGRVRRTH